MRRISLLFLIFLLACSSFAFATEEDSEDPPQFQGNPNFELIKDEFTDRVVADYALMAIGDGTRAVDYQQQIWNGFFGSAGVFSGNSNTWAVNYNTKINSIITKLDSIITANVASNQYLTKLINGINPDIDTTGISIYDLIHTYGDTINDSLVLIDSTDNVLSLAEILLVIDNNIDSVRSNQAITHSYIDGVEGTLGQSRALQSSILNDLDILIDLYGGDDYTDAKEDQADYESSAIEDFTGSGSAAASTQDLGNLKDVSTTIKSGLQTGGSVSNGLSAFSTNSGFWAWFTQANSNQINQPSSGAQSTRSIPDFYADLNNRRSSAPDVIDFYSGNQDTLHDLFEDPIR